MPAGSLPAAVLLALLAAQEKHLHRILAPVRRSGASREPANPSTLCRSQAAQTGGDSVQHSTDLTPYKPWDGTRTGGGLCYAKIRRVQHETNQSTAAWIFTGSPESGIVSHTACHRHKTGLTVNHSSDMLKMNVINRHTRQSTGKV